jgi:hypothetical protein
MNYHCNNATYFIVSSDWVSFSGSVWKIISFFSQVAIQRRLFELAAVHFQGGFELSNFFPTFLAKFAIIREIRLNFHTATLLLINIRTQVLLV